MLDYNTDDNSFKDLYTWIINYLALIIIVASLRPSVDAVRVIFPGLPVDCITARQSPLKAFLLSALNDSCDV